jgi:hypothetical protein
VAKSQQTYGQHFFCASLGSATMEVALQHLLVSKVYVYSSRLATKAVPSAAPLFNRTFCKSSCPGSKTSNTTTGTGWRLVLAHKSPSFQVQLHEGLLQPLLQASMQWQTWRNSARALPSNCSIPACVSTTATSCNASATYQAMNIANLTSTDWGRNWKNTQDHSKWGISSNPSRPLTCIGDLNRDGAQSSRGGGFACFSLPTLYRALSRLVLGVEACSRKLLRMS